MAGRTTHDPVEQLGTNEVRLVGRVSGTAQGRDLPSGDRLVTFRLVVPRTGRAAGTCTGVDTLDIACWSARTRAVAARLEEGQVVLVDGALRRRFFATPSGRASRHEVHARRLSRRPPPAGT